MLNLKGIKKDYFTSSETVHALKGVSLSFRKSEFVSILGPSGCGKTTLLNIIGGLDHYTDGDLIINGRSTKSYNDRDWDVYRNHRVGFIFQSYNLIPHQTVLGNVELALTIAGISKEERIERAKKALDRVGLEDQYYKRPNQLSGGQCQRVAIARALVNDPEILLADEPTGALDTVTSVQIMELIKEISEERLVIMVTHNPDLADTYSSRIIRLLDGNITEDTNPFEEDAEIAECAILREEEEKEADAFAAAEAEKAAAQGKKYKKTKKKAKEKAKMSLFTAFKLSARNLLSKKGRTAMVGFAGSIGIIGIAVVLAFSSGIKGYIASMQDDMLSGNPIIVSETTYDIEVLTGMMNSAKDEEEISKESLKAYINSLIEYVAEMSQITTSMIIKNDITADYISYIDAMPEEYRNAILYGYGIDMTYSVFTDHVSESKTSNISIDALTNVYTEILKGTDFSDYASYITTIAPAFSQAPNNPDYISEQYDVYGEIADEYDEVMLVLNSEQELSDILLARLGYYTEEEFFNLVYKVTEDERYDPALERVYFDYSELIDGKTFTWYPNDSLFVKNEDPMTSALNPFTYNFDSSAISGDEGVELKVTGVLITNENTTYGCLSSGIYYTEALTEYILEKNTDCEIVNYIAENGDITSMNYAGMKMGICYEFEYRPLITEEGEEQYKKAAAFLGQSMGMEDMMSGMMSGGSSGSAGSTGGAGSSGGTGVDMTSVKTVSSRYLGGNSLANSISIYPISFDSKSLVNDYLDDWNKDIDITVDGKVLKADERTDITYTDTLELVINLINNMIDIVSYALIAFTSISLVVSTVMIGIITYVSVVERIKEIGVIRALGGRKKDVRHLFNAETFIIGLLAGLLGIGVTYVICLIVNAVLTPIIGFSSIAMLPAGNAITLVIISVALTLISGLIPASSAAKKDPVVALRTE